MRLYFVCTRQECGHKWYSTDYANPDEEPEVSSLKKDVANQPINLLRPHPHPLTLSTTTSTHVHRHTNANREPEVSLAEERCCHLPAAFVLVRRRVVVDTVHTECHRMLGAYRGVDQHRVYPPLSLLDASRLLGFLYLLPRDIPTVCRRLHWSASSTCLGR